MLVNTAKNSNPIELINVSKNHLNEISKQNWLSYWKYFSRSEYQQCAENGCNEAHQYGVLVSADSKLFVVPVCKTHSLSEVNTFHIDSQVDIISADYSL
jgi:hypothetical protein